MEGHDRRCPERVRNVEEVTECQIEIGLFPIKFYTHLILVKNYVRYLDALLSAKCFHNSCNQVYRTFFFYLFRHISMAHKMQYKKRDRKTCLRDTDIFKWCNICEIMRPLCELMPA